MDEPEVIAANQETMNAPKQAEQVQARKAWAFFSDLLKPGFYEVALTVDGTVDGHKWAREINGTLTVGMDSGPVASSSTPWADLLQSALCWLTAKDRQTWLATLASGEIPPTACSPEKAATVAAEMEPALKAYRGTKSATKRGNVAFVPTIPPKA